jgi:succinate-semialdehyde dehydrogenase/glutarate-semialdehyde dehydrogenase
MNPATEEVLATFPESTSLQVENTLSEASHTFRRWRQTSMTERSDLMRLAAAYIRNRKSHLAALITQEMGKPIAEAEDEVEKCGWTCEYYAEHAEALLLDSSPSTIEWRLIRGCRSAG